MLTVNSVNTSNLQGYFQIVVFSMHSPLDRVSTDGTVCKHISTVRYGCHNVHINMDTSHTFTLKFDFDHIIPASGVTLHIPQNCINFEDDYVTCNDIFVLIGDNSEIPVLGFGTSHMKTNGRIVRLMNTLHVPDLDVDLISCKRHGSKGKGNTFLGD